jgi:hypothetical protein
MTRAERAWIEQTIEMMKRPSPPGARVPNPDDPGHWLSTAKSAEEIYRLMHNKDFQEGWEAVRLFAATRLRMIPDPKPAEPGRDTHNK